MTATIIPAARRTVDLEDLSIDLVCFHHALASLGNRRAAGKLQGYVEATLEANPGLAGYGLLIPLGTVIDLPEFVIQSASTTAVRLWD
jgi:phage tail protein X